jgi:hypothetical protein
MFLMYLIVGGVCLILASVLAIRRNLEPRVRMAAGFVAVVALGLILYLWFGSSYAAARRYQRASVRQGYAAGFGLGQHLKQTQNGRRLAVLKTIPLSARNEALIQGLKVGLESALPIVIERTVDITSATTAPAVGELLTTELLASLHAAGADIVVSFAGLPMRVYEGGILDREATLQLWRSPEYSALRWVLLDRPEPWLPECFHEGQVLAILREKPQEIPAKGFPSYLEIKGTPAELFNAWFELVTPEATE